MLTNRLSFTERLRLPRTADGFIRSESYLSHPCSKWTLASEANSAWLLQHAFALLAERRFRFKKQSGLMTELLGALALTVERDETPVTPPALAIPANALARVREPGFASFTPVEQYRAYYKHDKERFHFWTKRETPAWLTEPTGSRC